MIEEKRLRIDITDIRNNLVACTNPRITWVTQPGVLYPCIGTNYIEVVVTPDAQGYVEFFIQCDDCDKCPPKQVKRGLCDTSADCLDCEKCVDGWCVPLCPGSLCIDNTCVDCKDNDDCPDGQICLNGKCVCPIDKPFINARGECVACLTSDNCGHCGECYNGECVPTDCGDGVCNPQTGICEECLTSGDCGPNRCCVNKKCVCCPGYVWDPSVQDCVPRDECYSDRDCGVCEVCVGGECTDLVCPDGYTCKDNECVKLCECYGTGCPSGYVCVPYKDVCICVKCDGECATDSDCDEGCACNGTDCIPAKCFGECRNALDCGEGCGCLHGECVSCDSVNCKEGEYYCDEIIGCECSGYNCRKVRRGSCVGFCTSYLECGDGCTCYDGECVPCEWFSCEGVDCDSRPGCACFDGNCGGDGIDRHDCEDYMQITKDNADCDMSVFLSGAEECACPKIAVGIKSTNEVPGTSTTTLNFNVQLSKGVAEDYAQFTTLPLLSNSSHPDIADNEMPTTGVIRVVATPIYYRLEAYQGGTRRVVNSEIIGTSTTWDTLPFTNVAERSIIGVTVPKPGYKDTVNLTEVKKVKFDFYQITNFNFPNSCIYTGGSVIIGSFMYTTSSGITIREANTLSSAGSRYPLFTIYKSKDTNFSASKVFRKAYIPFSAGVGGYIDIYYGLDQISPDGIIDGDEGELWGNRYYFAKNDCSCASAAEFGKLVFCNPNELKYTLTNCNKRITIDSPFAPCDVNQDITQWNKPGYTIENDVQTKYVLLLNGAYRGTFVHKNGAMQVMLVSPSAPGIVNPVVGTPMIGAQFTTTEPITKVELKIAYDDIGQCDLVYTHDAEEWDMTYTSECLDITADYFFIDIPKYNNGKTISSITVVNGSLATPVAPNSFRARVNKAGNSVVTALTSDGCTFSFNIYNACCPQFIITDFDLDYSPIKNTPLVITVDVKGGQAPFRYTFTWKNQLGVTTTYTTTSSNAYASHTVPAGQYSQGEVTVQVIDAAGCDIYDTLMLNTEDFKVNVEIDPPGDICGTQTVTFYLEGTPNSVVRTSAAVPNDEIVIGNSGEAQFTLVLSASLTLTVLSVEKDGFTSVVNKAYTVNHTPVPSGTVSVSGGPCSNDTINLNFTGTPGATLKYRHRKPDGTYTSVGGSIDLQVLLDKNGTKTLSADKSQEGVHQITMLSAGLGQCLGTLSNTVSYTVTNSPTMVLSNYTCASNLLTYSVDVATTNVINTPTATVGSVASTGANTWRVSGIPSNTTSVITAVNGVCSISITTAQYVCNCGQISVPSPTPAASSYEYCDGDMVPTLAVTIMAPAVQNNWYYSQYGGTSIGTGLTLSPPTEPVTVITYWAEAQTAEGCVSTRVPISLVKYPLPTVAITGSNNLCTSVVYAFACTHTGNTLAWSTDTGTIIGPTTNPTVQVQMPVSQSGIEVEVVVTNNFGCTTTATFYGEVLDCAGATGGTGGIGCDEEFTYNGDYEYPVEVEVTLGADVGDVTLTYNPFTVPDRYIVEYDGVNVVDTGYVTSTLSSANAYNYGGAARSILINALVGRVDPITSNTYPDVITYPDDGYPTVSLGTFSETFTKSGAAPATATVYVYGIYSSVVNAKWHFEMGCPEGTGGTA